LSIGVYRQFYRPKTSALPGKGDGPGLTGDYSSASIVNYRRPPDRAIDVRIRCENDRETSLYGPT